MVVNLIFGGTPDTSSRHPGWETLPYTENWESHNITEYPLSYVVFQNTNFVAVILDGLFIAGKSGS